VNFSNNFKVDAASEYGQDTKPKRHDCSQYAGRLENICTSVVASCHSASIFAARENVFDFVAFAVEAHIKIYRGIAIASMGNAGLNINRNQCVNERVFDLLCNRDFVHAY